MRRALLLLLVLTAPSLALAVPPDHRFTLQLGEERFARLYDAEAVEVSPHGIVEAELLPSAEVRLVAKAKGRALVFVTGRSLLSVWLVEVDEPPRPELKEISPKVKSACPDAALEKEGEQTVLRVTVAAEACRVTLHDELREGPLLAGALRLLFTPQTLQAQLRALERAKERAGLSQVKLAYVGATLRATGAVTRAQRGELFQALWGEALGRLPLDDELTLVAPDAVVPQVMTMDEARKAGFLDEGGATR